jgi:hypothetical protein
MKHKHKDKDKDLVDIVRMADKIGPLLGHHCWNAADVGRGVIMVDCPDCGGSGIDDDYGIVCRTCDGTGTTDVND